jgi:hypothetical protein
MKLDTTNLLLILLGVTLISCFILMLMDKREEGFDPVIDAIESQIQKENPEQLKQTIQTLQQRLIDYGYAPDLKNYVRKTDLGPDSGKCLVANAEDRDKYVSKTDVPPPGPRIDLSQYVKKSSIPPEKVCPSTPTVDLSAYVKKSTLPPNEKCPPCISPKVKVSAGLCRECPPPPPCPAPAPCPACNCPPPAPCPSQKECKKCDEIRYIKVPAVITKTVTVDKDGNVISQKIDSGSTSTTQPVTTTTEALKSTATNAATNTIPTTTASRSLMSSIFGSSAVMNSALSANPTIPANIPTQALQGAPGAPTLASTTQEIPSTVFPAMSGTPNTTLAQTLGGGSGNTFCPSSDLNSPFGAYSSVRGRNESNFIY